MSALQTRLAHCALRLLLPIFAYLICVTHVQGQTPAQDWLADLDRSLDAPSGLMTGRLTVVSKSGRSLIWDFNTYKKGTDILYLFSSRSRDLELKLLYKRAGEICWIWDRLRASLFKKRDLEKFESILGSGFAYADLSGLSYESGYDPISLKPGQGTVILKIKPVSESGYTEIVVQMDAVKKRPIRMDFHGKDKVLVKTLKLGYDLPLYNPRQRKKEYLVSPVLLDVLDLETGRISRIEFFSFDPSVSPDDSLFNPDFLNR